MMIRVKKDKKGGSQIVGFAGYPGHPGILVDPRSGFGGSQFDILIPEDPLHVSMEIRVTIPEVGLDLTYDNAKGRHLVTSSC